MMIMKKKSEEMKIKQYDRKIERERERENCWLLKERMICKIKKEMMNSNLSS